MPNQFPPGRCSSPAAMRTRTLLPEQTAQLVSSTQSSNFDDFGWFDLLAAKQQDCQRTQEYGETDIYRPELVGIFTRAARGLARWSLPARDSWQRSRPGPQAALLGPA